MITVVITTYNRRDIVGRAVRSATSFASAIGGNVVVVDDASTDDTKGVLAREFGEQIASGLLNYLQFDENRGVTAAKNAGFEAANTDWVIFLDSDDELLPQSAQAVEVILMAHPRTPIVFFRCVDETNAFVGRPFAAPQEIPLGRFVAHTSYGEALVAINKKLDKRPPFDADLRGYEGIGCARLIGKHGPALLSNILVRRYDRTRTDRLSRPLGFLPRARLLAAGHRRYISICGEQMGRVQQFALRTKAVVYLAIGKLYAAFWTAHD